MNKNFLKKMKETLLTQKKELVNKSGQTIDIDTDGDEIDEIQGNLLLELHNQLNTRDITKVKSIDSALSRIENGTYGTCQDCEEDIPEKRLSSNPYFLTCVGCAEDREIEEKQRKKV